MPKRRERIAGAITGGLLLVGAILWILRFSDQPDPPGSVDPVTQVIRYASHFPQSVVALDQSRSLQRRDSVFLQRSDTVVQVGYIERIEKSGNQQWVHVRWYQRTVDAQSCRLEAYQNHGRLEDAIQLMFPPEKRRRIERLLAVAMKQHGQRVASHVGPILERALRRSLPAIESGLRSSMTKHRAELDQLAGRWNDEIIEQRLVPLAKQEIVPIVRRHAEPVAQEIGRELWERASLWSFTWRALYDKTPLPRKHLMKREWDRFVEQEAIPVLEDHADEIARAVQRTLAEVAESPRVREELSAAAEAISRDPQSRVLVQSLLREAVVENPSLRQVWVDLWSSDEVRTMLESEGRLLEPLIRQIGDELMGTRQQGIDPGFARLLRNQVLQKDQRWVMATEHDERAEPIVIEAAVQRAVYPRPMFTGGQEFAVGQQ